jgi:hypothetical protein
LDGVATEPAYQHRHLALHRRPDGLELELTDAALDSLIGLLENRVTIWPGKGEQPDSPETKVLSPQILLLEWRAPLQMRKMTIATLKMLFFVNPLVS